MSTCLMEAFRICPALSANDKMFRDPSPGQCNMVVWDFLLSGGCSLIADLSSVLVLDGYTPVRWLLPDACSAA